MSELRRFITRNAHTIAQGGWENEVELKWAIEFGEGPREMHEPEQGLEVGEDPQFQEIQIRVHEGVIEEVTIASVSGA